MNNFYRKLQVLNEKSFSFVTDSTSLYCVSDSVPRTARQCIDYHPLWLSFCVSLNFPTSPYLVLECYRRQFADHTRMKVGRSFWKRKRISLTKALLSLKNATITIGKVWYAAEVFRTLINQFLSVKALVSLNFIRLLRVVITPSVQRRKRLEAIGWISG